MGEGRGKTAKRKTAKAVVSVFFSRFSHIGRTPLGFTKWLLLDL